MGGNVLEILALHSLQRGARQSQSPQKLRKTPLALQERLPWSMCSRGLGFLISTRLRQSELLWRVWRGVWTLAA